MRDTASRTYHMARDGGRADRGRKKNELGERVKRGDLTFDFDHLQEKH